MDRNAYQSELDQVQFTEAGRSALTDALLAESLSSGERKNSSFEAYVYTQDALETLFASLNQG